MEKGEYGVKGVEDWMWGGVVKKGGEKRGRLLCKIGRGGGGECVKEGKGG